MEKPLDPTPIARRGLLLVLSSPSGAGKSTIANRFLARDPSFKLSVSVTTRPARPGEIDGVHYHFIDETEFMRRRDAGELLEWAQVFGNYYATPAPPIREALSKGEDYIFDIDWQGTQQLAQSHAADLVRVFILPPTGRELRRRLIGRAQDSAEVIAGRMAKAEEEISHWPEYDYVIVNDDLDLAVSKVEAIVLSERFRRERQNGLTAFVRKLQTELKAS